MTTILDALNSISHGIHFLCLVIAIAALSLCISIIGSRK